MPITKEFLEQRLGNLRRNQAALAQRLKQVEAEYAAFGGAILDTQEMLSILVKDEAEAEPDSYEPTEEDLRAAEEWLNSDEYKALEDEYADEDDELSEQEKAFDEVFGPDEGEED